MSDDIDIEEHDILDNPHIRNIFPDLSIVKKEISDFLSEAVHVKQEPELHQTTLQQQTVINHTSSNNNETTSLSSDNSSITQKNVTPRDTTIEFKPYQTNVTFQKNKIIIGSKPSKCKTAQAPENDSVKKQVRFPKVIIRDVKSFLENNKRYCKVCMILFSPTGQLCQHKSKRQVATENLTTEPGLMVHGKKCSLCNIRVARRWNLIRHYKTVHNKILTFKSANKTMTIETNKTKQKVKHSDTKTQSTYRCKICKSTFGSFNSLKRHNIITHLDVEYKARGSSSKTHPDGEVTRNTRINKSNNIDTECFHCKTIFPNSKSLIEHVYEILEPKGNKITKDQKLSKEEKKSENKNSMKKKNSREESSKLTAKNFLNKVKHLNTKFKAKQTTTSSISKNLAKIRVKLKRKYESDTKTKEQRNDSKNYQSSERKILLRSRNRSIDNRKGSIDNRKEESESDESRSTTPLSKYKVQPKRKYEPDTKTKEKSNDSKNYQSSKRKLLLRSKTRTIDYRNEESDSAESRSTTPLSKNNHNKSRRDIDRNKSPAKSKISEKKNVYVCPYCSYCFINASNYIKHIRIKHKARIPKLTKKLFDSKCKFCNTRNTDIMLYNRHLSKEHPDLLTGLAQKQNMKNYLGAFVFKSVLFRCINCDIHFISAEAAKDHCGHTEILINWKCYICDLIFKKSDKKVHLKQHTYCNNITVQVLDAQGLSSLLYHCTKCAIHFSEEKYLEHYQNCEKETAASNYCKVCDILINESDFTAHEKAHNDVEDFSLNVITSDIIFIEELACETERRKKYMDTESTETPKKVLNETLVYCPTCECFMTHVRKIHITGLCSQFVKHVCDICGIVMTHNSIKTHRKYHKIKEFKLQDLTILDMDGNVIKPPIPAYPQCNICKIFFTSRVDIIGHICDDTQYSTCEICQVKFSDAAFKLHMNYHTYALQKHNKINVKFSKSDQSAVTSLQLNKTNSIKSISNNTTPASVTSDKVNLKNKPIRISAGSLNKNSSSLITKKKLVHKGIGRNSELQNADIDQTQHESSDAIDFEVLFSCTTCHLALDSYDKVVEHCQNHERSKKLPTSLILCSICHLKIDTTSESHERVHCSQKPIKKLSFDVKYFSFDRNLWINHVFQSLSTILINKIIGKSIYKYEHRVRLQILQPGPPHLTVYKCAKCNNVIETENIFKHAGCTGANIRNIPCSNCGLTFISSLSRNHHQDIHVRYSGVNLNSYNIVLFNQESNQNINSKITHPSQCILYQCRNCHGLVDKYDEEHQCDVNKLKKCTKCGLLLYVEDFGNHDREHKRTPNFCTKNMKVILTGLRKETKLTDSKTLTPSFTGLMYDYTLYQCKHCKVCVKNDKLIAKHVCIFGIYRFKCHKCDFYFTEKAFKPHLKTHAIDLDFKKDNINIVQFDKKLKLVNNNVNDEVGKKSADTNEQDNIKNDSLVVISDENNKEVVNASNLFKCKCELHFVDKFNAIEHFKKCFPNQKCSKQNCTKCNLLFNPSELFTHLVNHHGDKTLNCKLNIIEITDKIIINSLENISIYYKCSKCTLHFSHKDVADSHFIVCEGVLINSKECKKCNIAFDKKSINFEEHNVICDREYQIVLIEEKNVKNHFLV